MKYLQYLILVSVLFFLYFLYRNNVFSIPESINYYLLSTSLIFSIFGILSFGLAWYSNLLVLDHKISPLFAIYSHNLSLPGKYIPGKVWSVFGRAAIVSGRYHMKFSHTSYCSFYNQFQMIWFGIPMAVVPLVFFLSLSVIAFIVLVWIVITVYAFKSNTVEKLTNRLINKFTKHNSDKPKNYVLKKMKIHTYIYFLLYWFFMSISLFFVLLSLDIGKNAFIQSFIFPLSGIIGNMAVVFPAGIGIKEGLMSTYFSLFSIPIGTAITIAVTHRMILVVSDMVLFILAYLVYLTKKEYLLDKQMKNQIQT